MNKYILRNKLTKTTYRAVPIGVADTAEQSKQWMDRDYNTAGPLVRVAWATEIDNCWKRNKTDGFWIDGIGRVVCGDEWEDTHTPFDKMGREIDIGSVIIYAMRDLTVSELKVEKIEWKYGYSLKGTDLHTGKKTKNGYPERCMKVSP